MARIKYSALVDQINGSIGGTTFQNNRYGFTIKRKPAGKKTGSAIQKTRRNAVAAVGQNWIGLTDSQRDSWAAYATTFPRATRLNPNAFLNGFNYFQKYTLIRRLFTETPLDSPSGAQQTFSFEDGFLEQGVSGLHAKTEISVSAGSWRVFIFVSLPLRQTSRVGKSLNRFITSAAIATDIDIDITTLYFNVFGQNPVAGDFTQIRFVYLNLLNGQIFEIETGNQEIVAE
jgi:hypothetical protein